MTSAEADEIVHAAARQVDPLVLQGILAMREELKILKAQALRMERAIHELVRELEKKDKNRTTTTGGELVAV